MRFYRNLSSKRVGVILEATQDLRLTVLSIGRLAVIWERKEKRRGV